STFPFRAPDTGQPSLAASARRLKVSSSMLGTSPRTVMSDRAIAQPASRLSNVITTLTDSLFAGVLFLASCELNAIEKQAACAAAMSSSGEVRPWWSSVRDAQVTGSRVNAPDDT